MALDLDGFVVWRTIGSQPDTFAHIKSDAAKSARTLIVKLLKAKTTDLAKVRAVAKALGREIFGLIADGMKDAEVKSLVARFDRYHPEQKTAHTTWRRKHLTALAFGEIEPTVKVKAKPVRSSRVRSKKNEEKKEPGPWYVSAGAVPKRRSRD